MARPSRLEEQRRELLPVLAHAFGELGFRRATTAELASRCGVRENILYRHWPDKTAMFVAAIDYVHDLATSTWSGVLEDSEEGAAAENLLDYEAEHLGEFGNYRIIFSALGDTDDVAIKKSLRRMYQAFAGLFRREIGTARGRKGRSPDPELVAWAIVGLGTVATIGKELGLMSKAMRLRLLREVGRYLLEGRPAS